MSVSLCIFRCVSRWYWVKWISMVLLFCSCLVMSQVVGEKSLVLWSRYFDFFPCDVILPDLKMKNDHGNNCYFLPVVSNAAYRLLLVWFVFKILYRGRYPPSRRSVQSWPGSSVGPRLNLIEYNLSNTEIELYMPHRHTPTRTRNLARYLIRYMYTGDSGQTVTSYLTCYWIRSTV